MSRSSPASGLAPATSRPSHRSAGWPASRVPPGTRATLAVPSPGPPAPSNHCCSEHPPALEAGCPLTHVKLTRLGSGRISAVAPRHRPGPVQLAGRVAADPQPNRRRQRGRLAHRGRRVRPAARLALHAYRLIVDQPGPRWFGYLTAQRIRRGVHKSVQALEADIRDWIEHWNQTPGPSAGTKPLTRSWTHWQSI